MLANNETGAIQPLAEIADLARRRGALVHCDAVQAAGRLPLDLDRLGVAMMTVSAHKIGGSQGVGALMLASGTALANCAIRVSFGPGNGQDDIDRLLDALLALRDRVAHRQPAA